MKRALAAGGASALAARGTYAALRRWPPAGEKTWTRTNHRGEQVTLLEGPALAVGAVTAQLLCAAVAAAQEHPERKRAFPFPPARLARTGAAVPAAPSGTGPEPAAGRADLAVAVAGLGALGFGVLDDLRGSGKRRGLRGHLGALAHGEVTTGTVKLAGLAVTGLAAALLVPADPGTADPGRPHPGRSRPGRPHGGQPHRGSRAAGNVPGGGRLPGRTVNVIVNAGLIAGGANLLNLFDLRPGRAIKVAALSAALITAGSALTSGNPETREARTWLDGLNAVAVPAGAALALLPEDLGERAMLGDAGANALGALLGAAAARALPGRARAGLLAGIVVLTVASEKVSFTRVIEATPPLRWLDMAGRRPPAPGNTAPGNTAPGNPAPGTALPGIALPGIALLGAPLAAEPDPPRTGRRRPGRHRRAVPRDSRSRSAGWWPGLFKSQARLEP